jgi:phosphotransferase system HPr (HPr) family protein
MQAVITTKIPLIPEVCVRISQIVVANNSEVMLLYDERRVNAKSVFGIGCLSIKAGARITVQAFGRHETRVIGEIADLLGDRDSIRIIH